MTYRAYNPALDGLRAVAVLLVLVHMGGFSDSISGSGWLGGELLLVVEGGWVGVELFFVLSGFLITGILMDSKGGDTARSMKHFYIRRSLRIFPLYYFTLLVLFVFAAVIENGPAWLELTYEYKYWFIFYLSNWVMQYDYQMIGHFWSLAVEEQFYLVWPFVILTLKKDTIVRLCFFVILLSPLFRHLLTVFQPEHAGITAYVWTPARLDALAAGALLAIFVRNDAAASALKKVMVVCAIVSVSYLLFVRLTQYRFIAVAPGWMILNQTMWAMFSVVLIYLCVAGAGVGNSTGSVIIRTYNSVLSLRAVRSIGKHSYAIYVFHGALVPLLHAYVFPVFTHKLLLVSLSGISLGFLSKFLTLFAVTYLLARLSWVCVEAPFLRLKERWPMSFPATTPVRCEAPVLVRCR